MKKYLILLGIPALMACNGNSEKQTALADSLMDVNGNMKNDLLEKSAVLSTKEAALAEFVSSFNEIQQNLKEITEKENLISSSSKDKELNKINKEAILSDIQSIYDLLDKNKKKVASLNKKLKDSNLQIDELQLAVTNLHDQAEVKENEISELKTKLKKMNVDFVNLRLRYEEEQMVSDLKTEKLNTAYYAIGTKKELTEKGLVTKEGGFIGLGKVTELSNKADNIDLTKIDITRTKEIAIHGDKVKLISTHPEGSYKLVEGTSSIDKIVILDPEKFWSISKYLIITTDKKKDLKN